MNFSVSKVSSAYSARPSWDLREPDPLYLRYSVSGNISGYTCLFSITKLSEGVYSLVDFGNARQKDKHYTTWERAYQGMLCICRRRFAKEI